MKVGRTRLTFGKKGISSSLRLTKGVRLNTNAAGKTYLSFGVGPFRFYKDLNTPNAKTQGAQTNKTNQNGKTQALPYYNSSKNTTQSSVKTPPHISDNYGGTVKDARYYLNKFLSFPSYIITSIRNLFTNKNKTPSNNDKDSSDNIDDILKNTYTIQVDIYRKENNILKQVTKGFATFSLDKLTVKANVTKEFYYNKINKVEYSSLAVYIYCEGRTIPLIIRCENINNIVTILEYKTNIQAIKV